MGPLIRSHVDPATRVTALWLGADGWVPNNPKLPAIHYHQAIPARATDRAHTFEVLFARNGWPPRWRNGIYAFHHYHSNAHEVLGIANGHARVRVGGQHGPDMTVTEGDCLLLPAGTGHCLVDAGPELLVVGAYPPGQDWNLRRDALSSDELVAMTALPIPATDPVMGLAGALCSLWHRTD